MTQPRPTAPRRPVPVAVAIPDTAALHRPWPELIAAAVAAVALSSVLAGK